MVAAVRPSNELGVSVAYPHAGELEEKERDAVDDEASLSNFMEVFSEAAVRDSPWQKFAPKDLRKESRPRGPI